MYVESINTNPLFKSYLIVFEQKNKTYIMCILSSYVAKNILENHNTHKDFQSMHIYEKFKVCHYYLLYKEFHHHLQRRIFLYLEICQEEMSCIQLQLMNNLKYILKAYKIIFLS